MLLGSVLVAGLGRAGFLLGVALVVVKARAEERLLAGTFGADCAAYCARTPQFVPGLRRSRRR